MVPDVSFSPLDLPGDGDALIEFLSREEWPFHSRARVTRADNAAMRRLFRKCGYAKEGHYRRAWHSMDGSLHDATHYAILREDWERGVVTPVPRNDDDA